MGCERERYGNWKNSELLCRISFCLDNTALAFRYPDYVLDIFIGFAFCGIRFNPCAPHRINGMVEGVYKYPNIFEKLDGRLLFARILCDYLTDELFAFCNSEPFFGYNRYRALHLVEGCQPQKRSCVPLCQIFLCDFMAYFFGNTEQAQFV